MFGKSKRPKDTMSVKDMTRLDKRPLKYVTMRDPETYKEVRLGENGAVNIRTATSSLCVLAGM